MTKEREWPSLLKAYHFLQLESFMRLGGYLDKPTQTLQAWLHSANSGITLFPATRWWVSCWDFWVMDITHADQPQRINGGPEFIRKAGMVALYRPKLQFEEWQEKGRSTRESWVLFTVTGQMQNALSALTDQYGYCHFQDPGGIFYQHIKRISEMLFCRRSGFQWFAQASFIELLALVLSSRPITPRLRSVAAFSPSPSKNTLPMEVENYIRAHISERLSVADLAKHAGRGLSAFAHSYRRLAGESPYHTIVRLKMEAAKHLLIGEGLSVKETAFQLGFSSEFQFTRCFKRMEGLAPSAHVRIMTTKG